MSHYCGKPCPEGCHDEVKYTPANTMIALLEDLAEDWANDAKLGAFHAREDSYTGFDGLDEAADMAMLFMDEDGGDYYDAYA